MKKEREIEIKCKSADTIAIDELLEFQGTLKKLSKENAKKLRRSIEKNGFIAPFFVWDDGGQYNLLDGHQRLAVLLRMREDGYNIPLLPVAYIHADNEEDAKRKLLYITSQYGEFTVDGFKEFASDLTDFDDIRLPEGEFSLSFLDGEFDPDDGSYTRRIQAPIYEPKHEKPPVPELFNKQKSDRFIKEINEADIPQDTKDFLILASYRHIVFDYRNIADFYAHSDAIVQDLMERSALVIIDFEKAIENGYIELSTEIASSYMDDYGEDQHD